MGKRRLILYFILVIFFTMFNFYYRPVSRNTLITEKYRNSSAYVNDLYMSDEYFKKNVIPKEDLYLYEAIYKDIKEGKDKSSILCQGSAEESCTGSFYDIYHVLYLDHPELIIFQGMGAHYNNSVIEPYYYHLSKLKTYLGTKRIQREIDIIKKETKNMNEKEKIIYVYNYVASHQYDRIFMFSMGNQSAYSFFSKNSSVCAGFAKASQLIFQNIGVKSYPVLGDEHMWNYVEYNGKYYVFDATVGASYVNKSHKNYYEGLGRTTVGSIYGFYKELYPTIEETPLKEIFGL